jgi:hypothetical protein
MKSQNKRYRTQWVGQFGVAHELTRRGYLVTFTTGNAPTADLLCESPEGKAFSVQIKSLSSKTFFLYQQHLTEPNLSCFFVFVLVPVSLTDPPEYFVLSDKQFLELVEEQNQINHDLEAKRGRPYVPFSPGINYSTLAHHDFRNAWGNLPK